MGEIGEFKMQTQDAVSQILKTSRVFKWGYVIMEKVLLIIAFLKCFSKKKKTTRKYRTLQPCLRILI